MFHFLAAFFHPSHVFRAENDGLSIWRNQGAGVVALRFDDFVCAFAVSRVDAPEFELISVGKNVSLGTDVFCPDDFGVITGKFLNFNG